MHAHTAVFKNKHVLIPVFKWFPLNAKCFRFGVKPKGFFNLRCPSSHQCFNCKCKLKSLHRGDCKGHLTQTETDFLIFICANKSVGKPATRADWIH